MQKVLCLDQNSRMDGCEFTDVKKLTDDGWIVKDMTITSRISNNSSYANFYVRYIFVLEKT